MIACSGRPLSFLNDEGFRDIIDPIIKALPKNDKVSISEEAIKDDIRLQAQIIREQITNELKNVRYVNFNFYFATFCTHLQI